MANPPIPSIDPITSQFPSVVRTRIAANLADPTTVEGAAVAGAVGTGGGPSPSSLAAQYMTRRDMGDITAQLKAQTLPVSRPRVLLMGDSITDQNSLLGGEVDPGGSTASVRREDILGYFTWANMTLRHTLILQREAGITGQGLQQMQARFDADIVQVPGEIVVFFGGINSIGNVALYPTAASLMDPIRDMCERALASGKKVVLCTLLTNEWNGNNGKTDYRQRVLDINQMIRDYAASRLSVFLCDWHSAVIDDTATPDPIYSNWRPGMSSDTTHPNPVGASVLGKVLADVLRPLLVTTATDMIAASDARNVTLNPLMSGTAGTRGAGTGQIADSWNGTQGQSGSGATFTGSIVWSKVARTDGGGAWQQVQLTSAGGFWMYQRIKAADLFAAGSTIVESDGTGGYRFKAGTKIRADIEWERDSDWSGVGLLKGGINFEAGQAGYSEDMGNGQINPTPTPATFPTNGVLRTPTLYTPAGLSQMLVSVRFSAAAGTIRVGRMGIITVP